MKSDETSLTTADGTVLHAYRWLPDGAPKAIVQVVHGMAEHAGRYGRFAEAATARGYGLVALDLRGHGKSVSDPRELGFFAKQDGWNKVLADLIAQRHWIGEAYGETPVILFGHSMGSFLAQRLMIEQGARYRAVVLSGSNSSDAPARAAAAGLARLEVIRLGPRGKSKLLAKLSFGAFNKAFAPVRTASDWLSRDAGEVDKYIADPLCGFDFSAASWRDLLDGLGHLQGAVTLRRVPKQLPVYIIAGSADPVSNRTKGLDKLRDIYRAAGLTAVQHKYYTGARHELLNETNREAVTADLLSWLDGVLPAEQN